MEFPQDNNRSAEPQTVRVEEQKKSKVVNLGALDSVPGKVHVQIEYSSTRAGVCCHLVAAKETKKSMWGGPLGTQASVEHFTPFEQSPIPWSHFLFPALPLGFLPFGDD